MVSFHLSTLEEKSEILALMQRIYPDYLYDNNFFDWQYLNNPAGNAKIFVAKDEQKIVGMYVLVPHFIIIKNNQYHIWRIQDVMMDEAYRKQGIFFQLMTYSHLSSHWTNLDMFWAFPNEKSLPSFERYGFDISNVYTIWEYKQLISNIPIPDGYTIQAEADFNFLTDDLLFSLQNGNNNYFNIRKDREYLTWRYIAKPYVNYEVYTILKSDMIKGYFVLKKYINSQNNVSLHICELSAANENDTALIAGLAYAIQQKTTYKALILNTFLVYPRLAKLLIDTGFVKNETNRKIVFYSGLSKYNSIADSLYFSLGDNDIF